VNRKHLKVMRDTARAVGLTQCLREIAASDAPLPDADVARLARALRLLGEPGYEEWPAPTEAGARELER